MSICENASAKFTVKFIKFILKPDFQIGIDGHVFSKLLKSSSDLKEVKSQFLPKQKDFNFLLDPKSNSKFSTQAVSSIRGGI